MSKLKKVGILVFTLLLMASAFFIPSVLFDDDVNEMNKPPVGEETKEKDKLDDEESEINTEPGLWEVNDEILMDYGSNPMPVYQDDDLLVFAYESRAEELLEGPSDKSKFMQTEDGDSFVQIDNKSKKYDHRPEPLEFSDGTYRRYIYNPEVGGIESFVSEDGVSFVKDDGLRYEIDSEGERDPKYFGVSTYFVDSEEGVVLLYNVTNDEGDIMVSRAYASPETDGMEFELTDENILGGSLETDGYADPNSLVRANGDIWLIIMHQEEGAAPPLEKRGDIYAYVSKDDGKTFDLEGLLMSYRDFVEMEVFSLNDPKIVEFPGNQLMVIVAAMVEQEDGEKKHKWVLVSAKQ
jgi:hypothetical protein